MLKNELSQYLEDLQYEATRLHELLRALTFLQSEGGCHGGEHVIAEIAEQMASKINSGLDSVNRPEVA